MSTTRRAFLQSVALSVCALPSCSSSALTARPIVRQPTGLLQIERVFFDARQTHALAFAETARQWGARTRAIWGDVDDRWYEELCRRWRTKRTAVAGMTDFRSLFLLQMMAADAGLRPVLRIHHGARGDSAAHEAFGAHMYRALTEARLANGGGYWSRKTARLVLSLPECDALTMRLTSNLHEANLRPLDSKALVTWVIA
jgi:hypothetical protein